MSAATGTAGAGNAAERKLNLVVVSGGASDPSSTAMLADRLAARTVAAAAADGTEVTVTTIELRAMANEIGAALVSQNLGPKLTAAVEALGAADGIVAATPIYKAGVSGLFKGFFDVLDNDLLIGTPVALAATAGTARHALVVDEAMRSLFAYMRTLTIPTAVFAATEDWSGGGLEKRIDRAAIELAALMESGFAKQVKEESWGAYQHEYGSAGGTELGIDLDSRPDATRRRRLPPAASGSGSGESR